MRAWGTVLLVALLLAGCAEDPIAEDQLQLADGTTIALGEGTSDTQGAIAGYVVDEAIHPLAGVHLATADGQHTATSDERGFFLMGLLDPGAYSLSASAPGYLATQSSAADVTAGETATVKVQLVRDVAPQPYHDTFPFEGYMQAWGTIAHWAVEVVAPTPLCACSYEITPSANATAMVFEAFWDPTVPDPGQLGEFYWEVQDPAGDWIQSGHCTDPCRAEVPLVSETLGSDPVPFPQGVPLMVRISGPDAWVAYQQQVHVFTTVFYNGDDATAFSVADPA